jgi:hypothetical protein
MTVDAGTRIGALQRRCATPCRETPLWSQNGFDSLGDLIRMEPCAAQHSRTFLRLESNMFANEETVETACQRAQEGMALMKALGASVQDSVLRIEQVNKGFVEALADVKAADELFNAQADYVQSCGQVAQDTVLDLTNLTHQTMVRYLSQVGSLLSTNPTFLAVPAAPAEEPETAVVAEPAAPAEEPEVAVVAKPAAPVQEPEVAVVAEPAAPAEEPEVAVVAKPAAPVQEPEVAVVAKPAAPVQEPETAVVAEPGVAAQAAETVEAASVEAKPEAPVKKAAAKPRRTTRTTAKRGRSR